MAKKSNQYLKVDEAVKIRKSDGTVKSFRCKARKSDGMRCTYLYAAMNEDAAQRRRCAFNEAVFFCFFITNQLKSQEKMYIPGHH